MKKETFLKLVGICLMITIVSCQQEEEVIIEPYDSASEITVSEDSEVMAAHIAIQEIGKTFSSVILDNPGIVELIKKEAIKQFDGEYDVLFSTIKDKTIEGKSGTIMDLLNAQHKGADIKEIIKDIPYFNIYFYRPDLLKDDNLLVLPIRYDKDDLDQEEVFAYNRKGEMINLSAKDPPEIPIICLGVNERVSIPGYIEAVKNNEIVVNKPAQDNSKTIGTHYEYLDYVYITDPLEPFWLGAPEVFVLYAIGDESQISIKQYYGNIYFGYWNQIDAWIFAYPALPQYAYYKAEAWERDWSPDVEYDIQGGFMWDGGMFNVKATFRIKNGFLIQDDCYGSTWICSNHWQAFVATCGSFYWCLNWSGDLIE